MVSLHLPCVKGLSRVGTPDGWSWTPERFGFLKRPDRRIAYQFWRKRIGAGRQADECQGHACGLPTNSNLTRHPSEAATLTRPVGEVARFRCHGILALLCGDPPHPAAPVSSPAVTTSGEDTLPSSLKAGNGATRSRRWPVRDQRSQAAASLPSHSALNVSMRMAYHRLIPSPPAALRETPLPQ